MPGYAIEDPKYQPALRLISAITNANPASVTTTFAHDYTTGLIVRLYIPSNYGMVEANHLYAPITVTGDTTFTIDINTLDFTAFAEGSTDQPAQVVPIGSVSSNIYLATRNVET